MATAHSNQMKCKCVPGCAFHWREQPSVINWKNMSWAALMSTVSTKIVETNRANGNDNSTLSGLSKTADELVANYAIRKAIAQAKESAVLSHRHGGQYSKARAKK